MGLKHAKNSLIADTADPTVVQPSDWNAEHVITGGNLGALLYQGTAGAPSLINSVASGKVLVSAGAGTVPAWSDTPTLTSLTIGSATLIWNASALQLGEEIRIAGAGSATAVFGVSNTSASLRAFATDVVGDTYNRFTTTISGELRWGLGATDLDTLFYRAAEAELSLYSINGNDAILSASSVAGKSRGFAMKTGTERRWVFYADAVAESGSNAGSDFGIARYDDDGNYLGTAFTIQRSGGTVSVAGSIVVGSEIFTGSTSFLHRTTGTLSNGAGAGSGTLTNAPSAGNPTKWISIDDNGTTRKIPTWT
jgi:hypothetical protein